MDNLPVEVSQASLAIWKHNALKEYFVSNTEGQVFHYDLADEQIPVVLTKPGVYKRMSHKELEYLAEQRGSKGTVATQAPMTPLEDTYNNFVAAHVCDAQHHLSRDDTYNTLSRAISSSLTKAMIMDLIFNCPHCQRRSLLCAAAGRKNDNKKRSRKTSPLAEQAGPSQKRRISPAAAIQPLQEQIDSGRSISQMPVGLPVNQGPIQDNVALHTRQPGVPDHVVRFMNSSMHPTTGRYQNMGSQSNHANNINGLSLSNQWNISHKTQVAAYENGTFTPQVANPGMFTNNQLYLLTTPTFAPIPNNTFMGIQNGNCVEYNALQGLQGPLASETSGQHLSYANAHGLQMLGLDETEETQSPSTNMQPGLRPDDNSWSIDNVETNNVLENSWTQNEVEQPAEEYSTGSQCLPDNNFLDWDASSLDPSLFLGFNSLT